MSPRLDIPVLKVDAAAIHQVDLQDMESLRKMWMVFTHCASALEEGRRLENLSWRVWTRHTLCCDSNGQTASLKNQVFPSTPCPDQTGLPIKCLSSLGEKKCTSGHTTSDDLEKIVTSITENKKLAPLPNLTSRKDISLPLETAATEKAVTERAISENASSPPVKAKTSFTSVVRGFSPVRTMRTNSSRRFDVNPSSIPTADITAVAPNNDTQPKAKTMFALGGSSEDSTEPCLSTLVSSREEIEKSCQKKKSAMFSFGGSSNEEEAQLPEKTGASSPNKVSTCKSPLRRPTTFQEEVARRTIREEAIVDDVFESDDEDLVDESAIDDDDDSSEWEDSVEGSGNASVDEKNLFQRVDSRANLTSRRSLITTMLHQQDRMDALMNDAMKSNSVSSNRSSLTKTGSGESPKNSPNDESSAVVEDEEHILGVHQTEAKPISRPGHFSQQLALSPRTTRRNMLASELTVSLRQHLLWERKQKSQTTNAALRRRHTTQDIAHLRQYPEPVYMGKEEIKASWDYYEGGLCEYNARGW